MRAVVITAPGGPDVLAVADRPVPRPAPGEVLVRVRAAALNRADLLQRRGAYPAPTGAPADVPGLEFAGELVEAELAGGEQWRPGDRVFGIVAGGAQAEYLCVHAGLLARIPPELDWVAAAAVPEAFITAFDALVTLGQLRTGERVLVHAVGSGVGLAAVQVACAVGAVPYGTSRTPGKIERAHALGLADGLALPDGPEALAERVRAWTGGRGVQVVLDLVGGPYVPVGLASLAERGRLVLVGLVAGRRAEVDLGLVLSRRLTVHGTVLRGRSLAEKVAVTRTFAAQVVPLLADGRLRPVVDATFPLDSVRLAHERLESNETFGKVVLTL
jgi:putative PIG3 family NAD(P)H quinone oxidoreductase